MFPRFLQDHLSVDAVLVLPTYEGPEAASLTPVAVGAHQSVSTRSVSKVAKFYQ